MAGIVISNEAAKEQYMIQETSIRTPIEVPLIDVARPADFRTATFGLG
jgi:hypothetical protein